MQADTRDKLSVALAALVASGLALALRLPGLGHGYNTDETGTVTPGGWFSQLFDPESGVNPPLWRYVLTFFPQGRELDGGRWIALLASVGAVAVVAFSARRLGGRPLSAWVAGLWLAVHLPSVWAAGTARVYGPWSLVAALHVLLVLRWAEAPTRVAAFGVAATAALLPWLHYATVPWLLLLGLGALALPGLRRLPLLYLPAAVGFLPLLERIVVTPGRRVPPSRSVGETLNVVVSAGLDWDRTLQPFPGAPRLPDNPSLASVAVVVLLALGLGLARRRGSAALWAVGSAAAFPLVVLVFAGTQSVRPPMAAPFAALLAPVLGAVVAWPGRAWARGVVLGVLGLGLGLPLLTMSRMPVTELLERDAVRTIAARIRDGSWEPRDVVVTPRQHVVSFAYLLTGQYVSKAPACPGVDDCVVLAGVAMRPRDRVERAEAPWILVVGNPVPEVPGCLPVPSEAGTTLLRCGP